MRVAALYDVHGNLPALEAVLGELERVDHDLVVVGGDVVAGPWPSEVLQRLRALGDRARFIRGNADREVVHPSPPREGGPPPGVMDYTRDALSEEQLAFLDALPERESLDLDGLGRVLFCHATPRSDEEIVTAITPDERLRRVLEGVEEDVVVCGHTHVQFDRTIDRIRLVNAGSVGMPYEREPGAYWALLGADVELRRTEYDVEAAAEAIRASGWPEEWPVATPEDATEFFESLVRE